ncbi:MAG: hypothetical protein ACRDRU_06810 [Pseudonocardiaceae bacterium]
MAFHPPVARDDLTHLRLGLPGARRDLPLAQPRLRPQDPVEGTDVQLGQHPADLRSAKQRGLDHPGSPGVGVNGSGTHAPTSCFLAVIIAVFGDADADAVLV